MFGSEIVSTIAYRELMLLEPVTDLVETRVVGTPVLPQHVALPAVLHYANFSEYDGGVGIGEHAGEINYEQVRYVMRTICQGTSTTPIREAARAIFDHFRSFDPIEEVDGSHYQIIFDPVAEVPETMLVDNQQFYRQLGTVFRVDITRGG